MIIKPFNPKSLPHNQIQTLFADPDDPYLWIGTYEGLSRMSLETEEFLNFTSDPTRTEKTNFRRNCYCHSQNPRWSHLGRHK